MSEGGHAVSTEDDGDELAVLRHRAYAPDADIEADPRALARLQQLEERVRARHADSAAGWSPSESASERAVDVATGPATEPVAARAHPVLRRTDAADPGTPSATDPAAPPSSDPAASDPAASDPPSPDAAAPRRTRARRRWIGVAVAVALAIAGLAAGALAPGVSPAPVDPTPRPVSPLAGDPSARVLVELPIDAAPPTPLDQANPPGFPVPQGLAWTSSYGTTYGWELWIARTQSGIPCLAVRRGTDVIANCAVVDPFGPDGVDVLVPYAAMAREDLPEGMTPGQSLAFWWPAGDSVLIAVGIAG